jgi:hypothetical protein
MGLYDAAAPVTNYVNSSDFKFACPFCQQHLAGEDNLRSSQVRRAFEDVKQKAPPE